MNFRRSSHSRTGEQVYDGARRIAKTRQRHADADADTAHSSEFGDRSGAAAGTDSGHADSLGESCESADLAESVTIVGGRGARRLAVPGSDSPEHPNLGEPPGHPNLGDPPGHPNPGEPREHPELTEPPEHPKHPESGEPAASQDSIAVVGLACRFPDADDAAALFQVITTGRRAFRRIPPCRLDLADYYSSNPATPDATYSTRAALIEGWQFDRAAFGISHADYLSTDPAHWLALETAARALAAAGFAGGTGLPKERTGVFIGNTLAGDVSRASALRLRWPYARQVIADALHACDISAELAERVLRSAAAQYLAPLPPVTAPTLAGAAPGTIAATVRGHLDLRGGGFAVDAGGASSLAAITSACSALARGELDVAIAGGVDVSLDPLDLIGLAKAGVLATSDVRIYDQNPTGFLPGEGCGMVLLMRAADAKRSGLPVYAELLGWGMASAGRLHRSSADPAGLLLAMRRAYAMARVDPADLQLVEGCGTGLAQADEAELTALAMLRPGARREAALGSITANIGNARAAAGAAGLIKTVLAATNGVVPPSTGVGAPHRILRDGGASLRLPGLPEPWPDSTMLAGISGSDGEGLSVHIVLGRNPGQRNPGQRNPGQRKPGQQHSPGQHKPGQPGTEAGPAVTQRPHPARTRPCAETSPGSGLPAAHPWTFLLHAADRAALTAILSRIAQVGPWLSDAQLGDLACRLSAEAAAQARLKVAIIATRQEQLARLASEAITILPRLAPGAVTARPGIFAADGADGAVTLLLAGQSGNQPAANPRQPPREQHLNHALAVLRRLDELGVRPASVVGHGAGELAGLVWAGCISKDGARTLNALRHAALSAPPTEAAGSLREAVDEFAACDFADPRCRLISGCTGTEVTSAAELAHLLSAELLDARAAATGSALPIPADQRLATAVRAGVAGASLILRSGRDRDLTTAIGRISSGEEGGGHCREVAVVTIDSDPDEDRNIARPAAALYAAGALTRPELLYAGRLARPIDIWREQIFIASPCQTRVPAEPRARPVAVPSPATTSAPPLAAPPPAPAPAPAPAPRPAPEPEQAPEPRPAPEENARSTPEPAAASRRIAGVGPWACCYAEQLITPARPIATPDEGPWRVYAGGCEPAMALIGSVLHHEHSASRTVALLGRARDEGTIQAAVLAAQDAVRTGTLVAISPDPGLAGLWATLHAEHPHAGITAIRAPLTAEGIAAARKVGTEPGRYRELAITPDGGLAEPAMCPFTPASGAGFPVGPDDVVLITRGSGAAGLVLAQVLACGGAAIAVIGRDHPSRDEAVLETLEQLRLGGAIVCYEVVDLASTAALDAAIRRIELRLGRVTAVAHAAATPPPRPVADLTPAVLRAHVLGQARALDQVVTAVRARDGIRRTPADQLKLIMTFGSVIGRYGLAQESLAALSAGVLADYGEQLASAGPGCQALHVDWPTWAGAGLGERHDLASSLRQAGYASMPTATGSRLLLKLLAAGDPPPRVAMHGRVGHQAPVPVAVAGVGCAASPVPRRRFIERVRLRYPGAELITEATLTPQADPYLADYLIDGVGLLPPAMALEAMAEVASTLAGRPMRAARRISMSAPVVLAAGQQPPVIRICAQRDEDDSVAVVIRDAGTGYAVDHFRATFSSGQATEQTHAARAASAAESPAKRRRPGRQDSAGLLEPADIYGPVCFQTGRFMRLTSIRMAGALAATGIVSGLDEAPWFGLAGVADGTDVTGEAGEANVTGEAGEAGEPELVLGSPAITDAALQVIQSCVPHRRLLFEGCDSATFSGRPVTGIVTIMAAQVAVPAQAGPPASGPETMPSVPSPRPGDPAEPALPSAIVTSGQPETSWNVHATDAAGQTVMSLRGLRMRDAGSLPRVRPWPVPLAGCFLQRAAAELGLDPELEVRIGRRADAGALKGGEGWLRAAGDIGLSGLSLQVRASGNAGCAWQTARHGRKGSGTGDAEGWLAVLGDERLARTDADGRLALARALASCAGSGLIDGPAVDVRQVAGSDWLLLRAGRTAIACTLLGLAGLPAQVAIAIRTGPPPEADGGSRSARQRRAAVSR